MIETVRISMTKLSLRDETIRNFIVKLKSLQLVETVRTFYDETVAQDRAPYQ